MPDLLRTIRLILFTAWAVIMTALTYVLGAPALKVLRRRLGRAGYWALTTAIAASLVALGGTLLGVAFYSLSVLVGVFEEFEEIGLSFTVSAFFALLINALLSAGAFALWVYSVGPRWSQTVTEFLQTTLKPVFELNPHLQIGYQDLMGQLPSVALILWMISIYVAVLLEGRLLMGKDTAAPVQTWPAMRPQLAALRLPDFCVWIFIVSLLGAFGEFELKVLQSLSINVLNVCIVLFFFQGIAVVAKFFESLRLGMVWQVLFMTIVVLQLFLFVSVLGLLDFWLGFRARIQKRAGEFKREA